MDFKNAEELLELCQKLNCPISDVMKQRECTLAETRLADRHRASGASICGSVLSRAISYSMAVLEVSQCRLIGSHEPAGPGVRSNRRSGGMPVSGPECRRRRSCSDRRRAGLSGVRPADLEITGHKDGYFCKYRTRAVKPECPRSHPGVGFPMQAEQGAYGGHRGQGMRNVRRYALA